MLIKKSKSGEKRNEKQDKEINGHVTEKRRF